MVLHVRARERSSPSCWICWSSEKAIIKSYKNLMKKNCGSSKSIRRSQYCKCFIDLYESNFNALL